MEAEHHDTIRKSLSDSLNRIDLTITKLTETEEGANKELQWYHSTDSEQLREERSTDIAEAKRQRMDRDEVDEELASNQEELNCLAPHIATLFDPRNWFEKEQRQLRKDRKKLTKFRKNKRSLQRDIDKRRLDIHTKIESIEATILRYDSFDLESHQSELRDLQQQIASNRDEAQRIVKRIKHFDQVMDPLIEELHSLSSRQETAQLKIQQADDLEAQLSSAENSYERLMIHEKCEELFGIGRPLRVISQQQKDIRQIKRDYQKLEKRVAEVASKASRTIDVIVIDGNNLCYDDVGFIGLSALETLVPILNREHTIVIVFDSAIRRMLKTNDRGLQKSLGDDIQVHVVASGSVADETVLDLAAKNDHTYILSNDRFGDYNDKEVVRAGRIIRHEIVGGQVFVHDLNARCNYR
jgi:hypothetical protein